MQAQGEDGAGKVEGSMAEKPELDSQILKDIGFRARLGTTVSPASSRPGLVQRKGSV